MSDYGMGGCCESGRVDFEKDPDETTDFAFDWSADLNGDTISSSVFLLPDGLTQVSTVREATRTAIFVSGGSCGAIYRITNRIATAGGRTWDKTAYVKVREH